MFVCYLSSYILSAEDLEDPVRELVMQPDIAICGLESTRQMKTCKQSQSDDWSGGNSVVR